MHVLLLLAAALLSNAWAQEPVLNGTTDVSAEDVDAMNAELEAAKGLYFAGGHTEALGQLQALAARVDPTAPGGTNLLVECLIYLGEIQYVTGDRAASWASFERVLQVDVDYQISAFLHPAEVVEWFGLVRRENRKAPLSAPDTPPQQPPPVWVYTPLGVPQLAQRRVGAGLALGLGQVATGGAAIGLHFGLRSWKRRIHQSGVAQDDPSAKRFNAVRYGAQLPATAAFYGLFVASVVHGRAQWRSEHRPEVVAWVDPASGQVGLAGRF